MLPWNVKYKIVRDASWYAKPLWCRGQPEESWWGMCEDHMISGRAICEYSNMLPILFFEKKKKSK